MLREIGKGVYGTRYAYKGAIPLNFPEIKSLKWGDSIRDCDGKGMTMYVNKCCKCGDKFFAGTLILVPEECANCVHNNPEYWR